ncbi:hypothetical protein AKJ09_10873 [Labilithrix luteola]|uniref:Uncharacterized protein n=1 Tax=Labilithrix luteola TaxID=1391654 RepID=A0A0K1QFM3_9BACT|nr:hypothetical protein AKJ09_10873 [Labilithrix luteola]
MVAIASMAASPAKRTVMTSPSCEALVLTFASERASSGKAFIEVLPRLRCWQ